MDPMGKTFAVIVAVAAFALCSWSGAVLAGEATLSPQARTVAAQTGEAVQQAGAAVGAIRFER